MEKKGTYIKVTGFTQEEKENIQREAKKQSLTPSAYCRRLILGIK